MLLQQTKYPIISIALLLIAFACTPEKVPAGDGVGNNGSHIEQPTPEGNLVGTVTDAVTGNPISGVPVTDGYSFTVTDENGRYFLQGTSLSRTVYISVPAEYEIPMDENNHPAFYVNGDFSDTEITVQNDFKLTPRQTVDNTFILASAADIHVFDQNDLKKFTDRSLPDMIESVEDYCDATYKEAIVILGGDQLSDNLEMVNSFKQSLAGKKVSGQNLTFLHCIGNHDYDADYVLDNGLTPDSYNASKTFVDNFGPTDYSLNIGRAHIVVMNNMIVKGTGTTRYGEVNCVEYDRGFTDQQLAWLKEDLALVNDPSEKVVILCVHVPVMNYTSKNYSAVKQLLAKFNEAHIISGHTHGINNLKLDKTCAGGSSIYEHNLQMMGGTWWKSNLSVDGSPAGFALMKFNGRRLIETVNEATGADRDYQIRVYSGNDTYHGFTAGSGVLLPKHNTSFSWPQSCNGKFIARVWNADADSWEVNFVKDGQSYPMTRISGQADECTYSYSYNIHDNIYGSEGTYHTASNDMWVIDAPGGDPSSVTGWKIVATHKVSAVKTLTYETSVLQRNYTGFAYGAGFPKNE